ncbi:unnamed protein product [Adineta ricciae]|uniref:Selenoprotein T n=1 Tax=Adineta ricciae TaxID=249248 RepID=A0A815B472_ADIRI|nr:unnamed protein product [Adineta ricciae]CAF1479031.1 unnamed protein product [Adineta ricciae]
MIERKILFGLGLVLLWTCYDLTQIYLTPSTSESKSTESTSSTFDSHSDASYEQSSNIPAPKIKNHGVQTIKYRNVFEQFAQLVRTHYPGMEVEGENYPPPPTKALIARVLSMVKMALLVCLLFSQNPFALLNIPTPAVYSWALQNKMYACLMVFFFSNSIESSLISTGAFEISVNDVPLWSKLQTGRLPSANEFIQMLQTFATNSNLNTAVPY